jgi:prepilin peptidase CpaA
MILAASAMVAGAVYDLKSFKIPNFIIVALVALALANALLVGNLKALGWLGALIVLVVGSCLWAAKLIGAGDVKFAAAILLSFPGQASEFLILTSLLGAVTALVFLAKSKLKKVKADKIPYGVPMALTGVILLALKIG